MAQKVKLSFDTADRLIMPSVILMTRGGRKLGKIQALDMSVKAAFNKYDEISFSVDKENDTNHLWDEITDFKLVWLKEWNNVFEIYTEIEENNQKIKSVTGRSLGEAELGQLNVYNLEINTEDDIERDDYVPTVLYNAEKPEASLLHRLLKDKAPHYKITHVDDSIAKLQRTFSFNGKNINSALDDIGEEIGCIFFKNCYIDEKTGELMREIEAYDLFAVCKSCGHRMASKRADGKCTKCGSTNIQSGYGERTPVLIQDQFLSEGVTLENDTDSVKNCFRLEAGDDLMTATIININPSGDGYLWSFSEETMKDMTPELAQALRDYQALQKKIQTEALPSFSAKAYNDLVNKYKVYTTKYKLIPVDSGGVNSNIVGYPKLMEAYYDTLDFYGYLKDSMMPAPVLTATTAAEEIKKITLAHLSPVAVQNIKTCSELTATNAVVTLAKAWVSPKYQVTAKGASYNTGTKVWSGTIVVTNYTNEADTAQQALSNVSVVQVDATYLDQQIKKSLGKMQITESGIPTDIISLFALSEANFTAEIKKYSLTALQGFADACQSCLDILIDQGVNQGTKADLYNQVYVPYRKKLTALENEIAVRQKELEVIVGKDTNAGHVNGVQDEMDKIRENCKKQLDLGNYLGTRGLWAEFASFRREDEYKNSNYISDGLNNAELVNNAMNFMVDAEEAIYEACRPRYSISSTLKDLLVIKEFKPLVEHFQLGNWIKAKVDGKLFDLRLIEYEFDSSNVETLRVTFSDVTRVVDGISDVASVLQQAASVASSYNTTQRQAEKGEEGSQYIDEWFENGLDATQTKIMSDSDGQSQTWDKHGMLFRRYDEVTESYDPCQIKIINSTIAMTDDNWNTLKTAFGKYIYQDPTTGEQKVAYGIIAETIVGKLIIGEQLVITNESNSLTFDINGLTINHKGKAENVFRIQHEGVNRFYIDSDGNLQGNNMTVSNLTAVSGTIATFVIADHSLYSVKNALANNSAGVYIGTDGIALGANSVFKVTSNGVITAASGTIGGWGIDATSIHTNGVAVTANTTGSVALSTTNFTRTVAGAARNNLRFAIGPNFGVTDTGVLYASSATITGVITATGGTIGGFTIGANALTAGSGNTAVSFGPNGLSLGGGTFKVDSTGNLYATSGTFTGYVYAKNIQVGATQGYITGYQIGSGEVEESNLYSGNIYGGSGTGSIGTDAVGTTQVQERAITNGKIGASAVTNGKIANSTITGGKIANSTITGGKIGSDTVARGNLVEKYATKAEFDELLADNATIKEFLTGEAIVNVLRAAEVRCISSLYIDGMASIEWAGSFLKKSTNTTIGHYISW